MHVTMEMMSTTPRRRQVTQTGNMAATTSASSSTAAAAASGVLPSNEPVNDRCTTQQYARPAADATGTRTDGTAAALPCMATYG